jgi:hypothetical protein
MPPVRSKRGPLHLGIFVEKHEHTGKDGGPIETADVSSLSPVEREQRLLAIQQALTATGVVPNVGQAGNGATKH